MSLTDLAERKAIPAFVRFERRAIEDKQKSLQYGRYIAKDVDYAIITAAYSRDTVIYPVSQWLEETEKKVMNGKVPEEYFEHWKKNLRIWLERQALPSSGTPIRGWGVISPAQQETIINMDILTVEDLIRSDKIHLIEGGKEIKNKAVIWLQSLNERGPLIQKLSILESENASLKATISDLEQKLMIKKEVVEPVQVEEIVEEQNINIDDLLAPHPIENTNVTPIKRRGRPPKVKE